MNGARSGKFVVYYATTRLKRKELWINGKFVKAVK